MNIVERARVFAIAAHSAVDQRRKYTNESYWVHPAEVAGIVAKAGGRDEMIAAAWLHDVVEDTKVTIEQVADEFGTDVSSMVYWLSNPSKLSDGNRAVRKKIDLEHTSRAPADVKTIKLADLISNSWSIVKYDPHFAKVYMAEKRELLKVLIEGDPELYQQAKEIVDNYFSV